MASGFLLKRASEAIIIPETVKKTKKDKEAYTVVAISDSAFYGRSDLKEIAIPNIISMVGKNAFEGCTSLKSIVLPDSIQTITEKMFCGCSSLSSIALSRDLTSIEDSAFAG